jgi:hypothetical protein
MMMPFGTLTRLGAVALARVVVSTGAKAQNESGQTPPKEKTPHECVTQDSTYWQDGSRFSFRVNLENTCDMRIRCTVFANVIQAKGNSLGHGTLMLGPANSAAAKKTYSLKVKMAGGMAQTTRECKAI